MPVDQSPLRPSLAWLALAVVPIVAGITIAALLLIDVFGDVSGTYTALDGPLVVALSEDEGRGIWSRTEDEAVSGFCTATGPAQAQMKDTNGVTVTSGGHEYHSFLRFRAPRAGRYRVDCATSEPVWLGPYVTAGRIFAGVGGALAAFFGGLLLAGLVVALVLLARERSKRRREREAQALR